MSTVADDEPDTRPLYLQVLWPRPRPATQPPTGPRRALSPDEARPYATKAFSAEVDRLAAAPEGQRNHALNEAAFSLSQLVAGGYLEHASVWQTLETVAAHVGLSASETQATLTSAFRAGTAQPRVVPELDATAAPAVTYLQAVPDWDDLTGPEQQAVRDAQATMLSEASEAVAAGFEEPQAPDIGAMFPALVWADLWADKSEDEWIAEPLLPARRLVALFSPPKVGKSLLLLELAVRISQGWDVLGTPMQRPYRVLYVDFENDPRGDVRTRLQAMGHHPDTGVLDDLVYLSFPSLAHLDTAMGGIQLLAIAQHYGAELVIIDTISRAVGGEENENDTWLAFYRHTGAKLKAAGIACLRLDHTGKDHSKGMRGGSAKYGDVDAVWAMTRLADDVFKLECTDNRLEVREKELTIRRHTDPVLRHVVDLNGEREAWASHVERAMRWLQQDLQWPRDQGWPSLWDDSPANRASAKAANLTRNMVREALRRHRKGEMVPTVVDL